LPGCRRECSCKLKPDYRIKPEESGFVFLEKRALAVVNGKIKSLDIIKGIGAGLCLLDRNLRIVWVNRRQSEWFGDSCQIYGRHCYRIFEKREHACRGCPTLKVFKTGNIHKANRIGITRDGKKHYYHLTVSPIKDNQNRVEFALELVEDVSEEIKRERKRIRVTRKLHSVQQHLSSANKRLHNSILRLKEITRNKLQSNHILHKKYLKSKYRLDTVKEELQDIFKVNRTLSAAADSKKTFSLITRFICELMNTDYCVLRLIDEQRKILTVGASFGIQNGLKNNLLDVRFGDGVSGRVAVTGKPVIIDDLTGESRVKYKDKNTRAKYQELAKNLSLKSMISLPVIFNGKVLGVISTYSRKRHCFVEDELKALNIFASQIAIALQESRYYAEIHRNYFNTIHTLVRAIEARDPYTRGHTERVTKYAVEFGRSLKLPAREIQILRYASEVHDLGKISIPDFILNKPGRLSLAERAMIELHPVKGAEMLEPLEFLRPAIPIVRHHHERYDGTGYPDGLEKDKIPLLSRILACADAFDAMTSERPYRRRKLDIEQAIMEIKNNLGSQFDPHLGQRFIRTLHNSFPS
jgi:PAS domain S-box-containing protein